MSDLTLDLDKLRPGATRIARDIAPSELDLADDEFRFTAPIAADLTARLRGGEVHLSGTLRTQVETDCARCLEASQFPFEAPIDEVWAREDTVAGLDPEQIDDLPITNLLEGDHVELGPTLREVLMAELPERVLCSPDCKGLCTRCGGNLNDGPCGCPAEPEDDRTPDWQRSLRDLKLDQK